MHAQADGPARPVRYRRLAADEGASDETDRHHSGEWLEGAVIFDGLDDALVGFGQQCGATAVAVYSHARLVRKFLNDGLDLEEALDHIDYNIRQLYAGDRTPMLLEDGHDLV